MDKQAALPDEVTNFLDTITDTQRQQDSRALVELMRSATGTAPVMWGSIIGFGTHHYKYETGREGDTVAVGFAPRKQALVLYGVTYYEQNSDEVKQLGKCTVGKGCLYIKRLTDVDQTVLREMVAKAYQLRNNAG